MKSKDFYLVCVKKNMCNWQIKAIVAIAFAILHVFFSCLCGCSAQTIEPTSVDTTSTTNATTEPSLYPTMTDIYSLAPSQTNGIDMHTPAPSQTNRIVMHTPAPSQTNGSAAKQGNQSNADSERSDSKTPSWYGFFVTFLSLANTLINASYSQYVSRAKLSVRGFPSIDILSPEQKKRINFIRIGSFITMCLVVLSTLCSFWLPILFFSLLTMLASAAILNYEIMIVSFDDMNVRERLREILKNDLQSNLFNWEKAISTSFVNKASEKHAVVSTKSSTYHVFVSQCIFDGWSETVKATKKCGNLSTSLHSDGKSTNYTTMAGYIQLMLLNQLSNGVINESYIFDSFSAFDIIRKDILDQNEANACTDKDIPDQNGANACTDKDIPDQNSANVCTDKDISDQNGANAYLAYDLYVYTTYMTMLQFVCEHQGQDELLSFMALNLPFPLSGDNSIKKAFARLRAMAALIAYARRLARPEPGELLCNDEGILFQTGAYAYLDEFDFSHRMSDFKAQSISKDAKNGYNAWYNECVQMYSIQKERQEGKLQCARPE